MRADAPAALPPVAVRHRAAPITLDGDLSDAGWRDAVRIDHFYETSPGDNTQPAVRTIALLTFDDRYFYVGVRCEDPNPAAIRAPYTERDKVIATDDYVAIFLDTQNDRRSAIELRVNPRGIQGDAGFNDGNSYEDFSPDYFYETAAHIDARGWTAEFRIPLSTLRYASTGAPVWNILVWRNYPRQYRYTYTSAPIARGSNCTVCHAQPLVGITALPGSHHLTVAPYVTAQQVFDPAAARSHVVHSDAGVDAKWNASATGAVDLTINPDFSEVEADVPQITVNQRFAVFFQEKRPFFLEGTGLFDTPLPVVYTRAINSPLFGICNTGKLGRTAYTFLLYTFLLTEDRGGGVTIVPGPLSSFLAPRDFRSLDLIGRVRQEVGRSFIGAVITDSEIEGGGHNRVIGPDFQWRPNADVDSITGEFLASDTRKPRTQNASPVSDRLRSTSHAAYVLWNHQDRSADWGAKAVDVGDHFRADLGFVTQNDYREIQTYYARHFYSSAGGFSYIRPSLFFDQQNDMNNRLLLRRISPGVNVNGVNGLDAFVFLRADQVRVGAGLLRQTYAKWQVQIDPSRRFTRITFSGTAGQMIDYANSRVGHGASVSLSPTVRPADNLTVDGLFNREWLDIAGGRVYTETIWHLKATYHLTTRSLVRIIGQEVTTTRSPQLYSRSVPRHDGSFLASFLYSYVVSLQTVLFLGYGDDRLITADNRAVQANRSFFLKLSYALRM
jgi:hypothetical protein